MTPARRRAAAWLAGLLAAILTLPALAWPGASSMLDGPGLTHAWVAIPASPGRDGKTGGAYLVHIPSRRGPPLASSGSKPASGGVVRVATRLQTLPLAMAAVEHRVYLVFEDSGVSPPVRQVLSLAAVPSGVGDLWAFEPADRLTAIAPLPAGGRLAGFAGTPLGPAALIDRRGESEAGAFELLLLQASGWVPLPLPDPREATAGPVDLVAIRGGVAVVYGGPAGPSGAWLAQWPAAASLGSPAWTYQPFRADAPPVARVLQAGGVWVGLRPAGAELELLAPEGDRWFPLAKAGPVPAEFAAVALDDAGLVAVLWKAPSEAGQDAEKAESAFVMREISAWTGRVSYEGPARAKGPISWSDFRLLALILLAVMTVVLIIAVRPEAQGPVPVLPPGTALAEPGHRAAAAVIDAIVCGSAALWLWDVPWRELINPAWIISARGELALLTWVLLGFGLCTLTEAWFGLSPGKALTGSIVVGVSPGGPARERGIGLRAAALRNAVKWMLPPLAAIGLLSPDSRHFGDVISGTGVVVGHEADHAG